MRTQVFFPNSNWLISKLPTFCLSVKKAFWIHWNFCPKLRDKILPLRGALKKKPHINAPNTFKFSTKTLLGRSNWKSVIFFNWKWTKSKQNLKSNFSIKTDIWQLNTADVNSIHKTKNCRSQKPIYLRKNHH